jgi:hypothetical protein
MPGLVFFFTEFLSIKQNITLRHNTLEYLYTGIEHEANHLFYHG